MPLKAGNMLDSQRVGIGRHRLFEPAGTGKQIAQDVLASGEIQAEFVLPFERQGQR
jgi:hypothetical protein